MENSKIIRYCERCRKNKDNSIFKKYGNLCKEFKENQYDEQISKFYRKLKKGVWIVICRVPNHTDLPISS